MKALCLALAIPILAGLVAAEDYAKSGADCKDTSKGCFGGYARVAQKVGQLRKQHPDSLWLNAGDEFQGTLFYSFYGGEKIAETVNHLQFDAMTLGNHEWDGGDKALGNFLKNLTFPVVSCNVKSTDEALNKTIKNYHIFDKHGLAVIGVTTDTTPAISNVGKGTTFLDPIAEVQKSIWEIRNKTDIKRIVALTHIGYIVDQKLAAETEGLSLVIGGHSHTLLGDMAGAEGKYPTIVKDRSGHEVFVVTSYRWGEYLGSIDLTFDADGKALAYRGAPIHMDNTTALEKELQDKIESWRGPFEKYAAEVVGVTKNELDQTKCQQGDCLLGQVLTDAMLAFRLNQTRGQDPPDFALANAGGIRATIDAGNVTRGEVLTSFPFGNAVAELKYKGSDLRKILEGCVSKTNQFNQKKLSSWFQVSDGIVIEYNPKNAAGSMLVNVTIGGKQLSDERDYRVVTVDFLAGGGDNILPATKDFISLDTLDEVLVSYIQQRSPLGNELQKRVVSVDKQPGGNAGGNQGGGNQGGDSGKGAAGTLVPAIGRILAIVAAAIFVNP
ncbi:Apyrase [Tolypocladium ophioglossoides CBS 100239]|uniref:Apyrase n=1 Tax=Tolypocladium ophioglossoides (strain CBS 100239) TaxID=1163406 RepID=A0A0L0N5Q1_TOLOC|nr:Apyrase [Tolypocladium ophioglossoides CBS 100239]